MLGKKLLIASTPGWLCEFVKSTEVMLKLQDSPIELLRLWLGK